MLTVRQLAEHKGLPEEFLRSLGLEDRPEGVAIPYHDATGAEVVRRRRTSLVAGQGSYWPRGATVCPYGRWRLDEAARAGFLVLVEGESDCWALWAHAVPALGLPGADTTRCLTADDLAGVERLYVHREPDAGGSTFVQGVARRLAALGWQGRAATLDLAGAYGVKDPSDLHRQDPGQFAERLAGALARAAPLSAAAQVGGDAQSRPPSTRPAAGPEAMKRLLDEQRSLVECCSHDTLLDLDLPPLRWLVEGLLPDEALTFLGGKKKLGKSFACLQIAQAVATGCNTLGRTTTQGRVVYLCLEDGRRRVRQRLKMQLSSHGLPIDYYTRFPRLDGEGLGELMSLLAERTPRLLIIDTLAAAKSGKLVENDAGPMADLTNSLRVLAQHYKLGILVTHHHGKGVGGDPGDDLRGSSAIAAAADVNLGLYREEGVYTLRGEGRDLEPFNLRVQFDKTLWCWQALGDAATVAGEERDDDILTALQALGELDARTLADQFGWSKGRTAKRLTHLVNLGKCVAREVQGSHGGSARVLYRLASIPSVPPQDF